MLRHSVRFSPYSICSEARLTVRRSFIGTIVLMTVENTTLPTKVGLLISYYITLSFWSAQTLTLSMVSRNIAGQTKKSTVVAATFVSWAAGNAIGKYLAFFMEKPSPQLTSNRSSSIPRHRFPTIPHCLECSSGLLCLYDFRRCLPPLPSQARERQEG